MRVHQRTLASSAARCRCDLELEFKSEKHTRQLSITLLRFMDATVSVGRFETD